LGYDLLMAAKKSIDIAPIAKDPPGNLYIPSVTLKDPTAVVELVKRLEAYEGDDAVIVEGKPLPPDAVTKLEQLAADRLQNSFNPLVIEAACKRNKLSALYMMGVLKGIIENWEEDPRSAMAAMRTVNQTKLAAVGMSSSKAMRDSLRLAVGERRAMDDMVIEIKEITARVRKQTNTGLSSPELPGSVRSRMVEASRVLVPPTGGRSGGQVSPDDNGPGEETPIIDVESAEVDAD